jgi:hypothetical protein
MVLIRSDEVSESAKPSYRSGAAVRVSKPRWRISSSELDLSSICEFLTPAYIPRTKIVSELLGLAMRGLFHATPANAAPPSQSAWIQLLAAFAIDLLDESFLLDFAHNAVIDQIVDRYLTAGILL